MPPLGEETMLQIDLLLASAQMLYFTSNAFRIIQDQRPIAQLPSRTFFEVDADSSQEPTNRALDNSRAWGEDNQENKFVKSAPEMFLEKKPAGRRLNLNIMGIRVRSRLKAFAYDSSQVT
jgi:hypothetical protein